MNATETKTCPNCRQPFVIEPEDFVFYEKIKVPPPTWCPECRMQRRMTYRNERSLHKRICELCKKSMIAVYSSDVSFPVYCNSCWWSDKWDVLSYGKKFDANKSFWEQLVELLKIVPRAATSNVNCVNCDYNTLIAESKNTYLSIANSAEDSAYVHGFKTKDTFDVHFGINQELCYETIDVENGYKLLFAQQVCDSNNSAFLYDCRGVQDCFGCVGLRNKRHYIFNAPYSKAEYRQKIKEFDLGSYKSLQLIKSRFDSLLSKIPRRFAFTSRVVDVTGNNLHNTKACHFCFDTALGVENCKYVVIAGLALKDSYDLFDVGNHSELIYESEEVGFRGASNRVLFSTVICNSHNVQYSQHCFDSGNLFGCIGIRSKEYCILNRRYSKEEFQKLTPRLIDNMKKYPYVDVKGRLYHYGEFFPSELSPYSYNEAVAQEYFPLTKAQALERGYAWRDTEAHTHEITKPPNELPDHIKDVPDSILNEIIGCSHEGNCNEQCTVAFKLIPQELQFYRKMNLPLPRLCPNCRHYQRVRQRNPLKLWHRQCACAGSTSSPQAGAKSENGVYQNTAPHFHGVDHCPNEFETTYAPDRPEIVYCEACYNTEVV